MRLHWIGCAAALLLSAHAATAATFTWASASDTLSMDPHSANDTTSASIESVVYETLVEFGPGPTLEPMLAESWSSVAPDRWRFVLRHGVTFHDGRPFTADDVVFSIKRALADTADTRQELTSVRGAEKVDTYTVDILTKGPDLILPRELADVRMASKAWSEEHDAVLPTDLRAKTESYPTRHENGTGAYRMVTREPDSKTVFEANPNWWHGRAPFDQVVFMPVANDATRVAALLSGALDMMEPVPVQDLARVEQTAGLKVQRTPSLMTIHLGFDQFRPELLSSNVKGKNPFKNVRVRRAFSQAIDMDAIQSRTLRNLARTAGTMVAPQVTGWGEDIDKRPPYDPAAAKRLLADAGYPDGFEVGLDCPNNRYQADEAVCQAVVAMLARIGVKVTLSAQPKAIFFPKLFRRNVSFWMFGYISPSYDASYPLVNLIETVNEAENRGNHNHGEYSNPAVDDLIHRAGVEMDPEKRTQLMHEALRIHGEDVGHIPLYQQSLLWGMRQGVEMVQLPDGLLRIWRVRMAQ